MSKKKETKDIYDFDYSEEVVGSSDTDGSAEFETVEIEEQKKTRVRYRYFCDACTNIAFLSDKVEEGLHGVCQVCGKPYVTKKENFIKL